MARLSPHFAATLLSGFLASPLVAQNNALDFDGSDDRVVVPAASQFLVGASGITLSCWVYPRNTAPAFPDFDGIAGFRNELDCDFYLVQISPANSVEGRIRVSNGLFYTVTSTALQMNTWQHLALVFDGAALKLYHNGTLSASIPASGTITNPGVDMLIGDVVYDINDFYLDGKLDEVLLFGRALPADEVQCLSYGEVHDNSDLLLYYTFDQGIAGGTNTGITALTDLNGAIDGVLNNFALSGTTSNFVNGFVEGSVQDLTICQGESIQIDGLPVSSPGTYTGTITSTLGCTTTATVNLSVTPVQTGVTQLNVNLIALATGAQFQWLNCGNGFAQVAGATAATFTPTANGSYAVEVTQGGCTDTSACYAVVGIGLNEQDPLANMSVRLDADGHTLLVVGGDAMGRSTITVRDVQGRPLRTEATSISSSRFDLAELPTGPYLVQVTTAKAQRMWRVVLVR